jgi:hypothetical protein
MEHDPMQWTEVLRVIEGFVIMVLVPVVSRYVLKAYGQLKQGQDGQRAAMLDRMAAGLLEELLAGIKPGDKVDIGKVAHDLTMRMQAHPQIPTKNQTVIKRVAGVAVRKALRLAGGGIIGLLR